MKHSRNCISRRLFSVESFCVHCWGVQRNDDTEDNIALVMTLQKILSLTRLLLIYCNETQLPIFFR